MLNAGSGSAGEQIKRRQQEKLQQRSKMDNDGRICIARKEDKRQQFQAKKASAALLEDGGESSTVARKASGGSGDDESGRNGSSGTARIRTISDSALAPSFPEAATGSIPGRTSPDPFADGELDKVHRVNQNNFGKKGLGSSER